MCPACGNGVDDDGDGAADYPNDTGCSSASDGDELTNNPAACGEAVELKGLDENGLATGTIDSSAMSTLKSNGCGGSGGEMAFSFAVTKPSSLVITTDFPETDFDTVIYVRSSCGSPGSELGCNDDGAEVEGRASTLVFERVEPGEYYLIVDGQFQGAGGTFTVQVNSYVGRDEACEDGVDDCAPGLFCQNPMGSGATTCVPPRCSDGVDNDGDGAIDWPLEPGCATLEANDELDDCPSGPGCASCSNGIDDDGDGLVDYGMDIGCGAAGDNIEEDCDGELDDIVRIDAPTITGTTTGGSDDFAPSCTTFSTAPEIVHLLDVPGRLLSLHVDSSGSSFDNIIYMKATECSGADLGCSDPGTIDLSDVDPGQYYIFMDGWSSNAGDYMLNVNGVIASGEACDPAMIDVFSCQAGLSCDGGVCATAACNDGTDADGDGHPGYPTDPGCDSPSDNDETDTCPGAGCPQCSNGIDDDGDMVTDYPNEPGCASAADDNEEDCSLTGVVEVMATPIMGTTTGESNEVSPSCSASSAAGDVTHQVVIPGELETLTVDTNGSSYDTVLVMRQDDCGGSDWACDDDGGDSTQSMVTMTDVPAGTYYMSVDGYSTREGAYMLNVTGVIKSGEACDAALEAGGILTCGGGTSCTGGMCQ